MVIKKEGSYWTLYSKDMRKIPGKLKPKKDALHRERQMIYFNNLRSG